MELRKQLLREQDETIREIRERRKAIDRGIAEGVRDSAHILRSQVAQVTVGHPFTAIPGLISTRIETSDPSLIFISNILGPGLSINSHTKDCAERFTVLFGDLTIEGKQLQPGDSHLFPAGEFRSASTQFGCVFLAELV